MSALPQSQDWPANSLPERWIEALFSTMAACYGARFADLWRGSAIEDVKRLWGIELFKLTREHLKAGRENLTALAKPPTLPEFVAHCRQSRVDITAAQAVRIEHKPPISTEKAQENMRKLRAPLSALLSVEPTAEWAFKALMRAKSSSGGALTAETIKCATDAITSGAGRRVIDNCIDPVLRANYAEIRQATVDGYRMRGRPLWEVK